MLVCRYKSDNTNITVVLSQVNSAVKINTTPFTLATKSISFYLSCTENHFFICLCWSFIIGESIMFLISTFWGEELRLIMSQILSGAFLMLPFFVFFEVHF